MPRGIRFWNEGPAIPVATEDELLEFANKVRTAGGANILEALMPSMPGRDSECLIANALNFSCEVRPLGYINPETDERQWFMYLPTNMSYDHAVEIAAAIECDLESYSVPVDEGHWITKYKIKLPDYIGNAAHAFDNNLAFEDYNLKKSRYA